VYYISAKIILNWSVFKPLLALRTSSTGPVDRFFPTGPVDRFPTTGPVDRFPFTGPVDRRTSWPPDQLTAGPVDT
jgi:hypothetical protein